MSTDTARQPPRGARLLPSLLDRLTDQAPQRRSESAQDRVLDRAELRRRVLRDLTWLLNTTSLESEVDLGGHPAVRDSVLNFGLRALSGKYLVDDDLRRIETSVCECIRRFEPRILPDTVQVRVLAGDKDHATRNWLGMEIRGQLWAEPYPVELLLRSRVDLESGQVALEAA